MNASNLCEHPPKNGKNSQNVEVGTMAVMTKTSLWDLNGFSHVSIIRGVNSIVSERSPTLYFTRIYVY